MNKYFLALTALALIAPAMPAAVAAPLDRAYLKAAGCDIRDQAGKGDIVPLRGVNLGGWLLMEGWQTPMDSSGLQDDWSVRDTLTRRFGVQQKDALINAYEDAWITDKDIDNIASYGMNVIRLPFWYLNLQEEDGTWRKDAFNRLDWLVAAAWKRGIYTVLDLHGVPGGQSAVQTTGRVRTYWTGGDPNFWTKEANLARAVDIWERIATHYRGNPAVAAYDLLNEPMGAPSHDALWAFYDRCYKAIRRIDPDHIVSMEGCFSGMRNGRTIGWGWDSLPLPTTFGWTNVLYQQHSYDFDWNNAAAQKHNTDTQVNDWRNHRVYNVPCLIGEFNCMAHQWAYTIGQFNNAGMSWIVWTYKATHGGQDDGWGLVNPADPGQAKPNIQKDSAETIRQKWAKWTTDAFVFNLRHRKTLAMPIPVDDRYAARIGKPLTVAKPGVLVNDRHLNRADVTLMARPVSGPLHGRLELHEDGSFLYTPEKGFVGYDSFRYRAFDGAVDSARFGQVTLHVSR